MARVTTETYKANVKLRDNRNMTSDNKNNRLVNTVSAEQRALTVQRHNPQK